jgi:hypothetical protein
VDAAGQQGRPVARLQLDVEQVVPMHGRLTTMSEVREAIETYGNTQLGEVKGTHVARRACLRSGEPDGMRIRKRASARTC